MQTRRNLFGGGWLGGFVLFILASRALPAADLPIEKDVEWQPFAAQVGRLIEAADYLGSPFIAGEKEAIEAAMKDADTKRAAETVQTILDRHCLFGVTINPEMRVKVAAGPAKPELVEQGWRQFLVKVVNDSGTTAELRVISPNAVSVYSEDGGGPRNSPSDQYYRKKGGEPPLADNAQAWLDLLPGNQAPLSKTLSGLRLEYRIVQLYSRDAGRREAKFSFDVGQGTQDVGFRSELNTLFTCLPARTITLQVWDENDRPTTASFEIRDMQHRVYPSPAKRLAPDFPFQAQIYRGDGETLKLPDGGYTVEFSRGPESITHLRALVVTSNSTQAEFKVERWIDPSRFGWWSGDHHIHAAGCAHYVKPTEGVLASDMIRHCMGEDVKIGANLTWGPCFDYQKQFFCGAVDKVSQYPYLLRYDIEVSGFGSHQSGHLVLLRLKEEIYPGGDSKDHWPTLGLNTLRWAKKQGSVCGPAHSGWGLEVPTSELPNYIVPPYNGIGANEYIVDVTHELPGPDGKPLPAVDFFSLVDTPSVWELNMWYQTLNVGYRTRASGETDFPCIYDDKVGLGRSYVKLDGKLDYDAWCEGIRQGRNYVGDGKSHLMDFKVNDIAVGEDGSELKLSKPASVTVTARIAARLNDQPNPALQKRDYAKQPYWDIERARIGDTREVPVEVIVNGYPVEKKSLLADGKLREVSFDVKIDRSSWVALRILPSSHTNPIFVLVDGKPIRASKRSAEWCLKGVEQCWSQKEKLIKASELDDARKAYDHARTAYKRILAESERD